MAKNKKNKRQNAEAVNAKKATARPKQLNPFEVHLNKEKFKILGRKNKHDRGLPGVSRAKAQKKRKQTLGREYLEKHKTNQFKDNRIGRGAVDCNDELATARFKAERLAQHKEKKKSIYNLDEDEMLTHRGQTLEEIEQFREPASDDSEDEVLDADFTETTHFGGGDDGKNKLDRKTAIDEMIAETKRKKAEAAKDKDEVYELTSLLDSNYKSLIPMIGKLTKRENQPKPPQDDYDRVLREMIFEPRGEVSDKLESAEEIQRKEKERLQRLEQERLARMRGEDPTAEPKPTHRSADALDDGYFAGSDNEEEPTLAYNVNGDLNTADETSAGQVDNEALGDDTLENQDNDVESELDEADQEEGEEEEETDEDSMDDLKYTDTESEEEDEVIEATEEPKTNKKSHKEDKQKTTKRRAQSPTQSTEEKEEKRKRAEKQLPFTFDMPESYEQLAELLEKHSSTDQSKIVERIIKCHHPRLDPSNKEKMLKLFTYLLQNTNDLFSEASAKTITEAFLRFDKISPQLHDLVQLNADRTSACILEVIKEKYEEYKKSPKVYPHMDTIIFFKLASNLFSTSDFRHPVVTPCFLFISHVLSRARIRNRKDLARGLLLVTIAMEYTTLSERFLPSAINYLLGIIFLAVRKRPVEIVRIVPPFQSKGTLNSLLALSGKVKEGDDATNTKLLATDLVTPDISDDFKVRALHAAFAMLTDFASNTTSNVGLRFILEPFPRLMDRLDMELYPNFVSEAYGKAQQAINSINEKPLLRLVEIEKKPKALRLMEPKIVPVHDDKRRPKMSQEKETRAILTHKIKRETKGAMREIRRDNAFLSKMQLKKQIQSDMERKEKVRRIYAEASVQQGELNELARSKKKGKF